MVAAMMRLVIVMGCASVRDKEESEKEDPKLLPRYSHRASTTGSWSVKTDSPCLSDRTQRSSLSFETIRRLKEGIETRYSMGETWVQGEDSRLIKAEYIGTGKPCVIKEIRKQSGRLLLQQRVTLNSDIERLSSLDHPYILKIYETFEDDKYFYVVFEPFTGGLLQNCITSSKTASEEFIAAIMFQVFSALNYCLQRGIIHGKLSPRTIVLCTPADCPSPKVKITGFYELDSIPFDPALPVNSFRFKAPESAAGFNEKSDVWSCGVIILYLLFPEAMESATITASSPESVWKAGLLESLSGMLTRLSPELMALLSAVLNPSPIHRLTPGQCRQHPWIIGMRRSASLKASTLSPYLFNLRKVNKRNPLQNAVLKFILAHITNENEAERLMEPFTQLDKDGDGVIGEQELMQGFMRILPEEKAVNATKKVMEAATHNSNGTITYSEFLIASMGEKKLLSPANLKRAFCCFDKGKSGAVTAEELGSFLCERSSSEKIKELRAILKQADRSGDNQIHFKEFSALMANVNPS